MLRGTYDDEVTARRLRGRAFGLIVIATLVAMAGTSAPRTARADTSECLKSFEAGQVARRANHLLEARGAFVVCGQDECPAQVKRSCIGWLSDVERAIPGISIQVQGRDGCDHPEASVQLDASPVVADGRRIEVDPGSHVVRVELAGEVRVSDVVAADGERQRVVRISFGDAGAVCGAAPAPERTGTPAPIAPSTEPGSARPLPSTVWILGGVGIAALGVGGAFGIAGFDQKGTLDDCKGTCAQSDVDTMQRTFLIADVGLGIGLVALAAATVLYLTR
jgi:hypothetical protein